MVGYVAKVLACTLAPVKLVTLGADVRVVCVSAYTCYTLLVHIMKKAVAI